ncbi:hypothetical protein D3C81_1268940 [compost metagenome]
MVVQALEFADAEHVRPEPVAGTEQHGFQHVGQDDEQDHHADVDLAAPVARVHGRDQAQGFVVHGHADDGQCGGDQDRNQVGGGRGVHGRQGWFSGAVFPGRL